MAKFRCDKCKVEKEIKKQSLVVYNGKVVAKEAWCFCCKKYMKDISKFEGFGKAFQAPTDKYKR